MCDDRSKKVVEILEKYFPGEDRQIEYKINIATVCRMVEEIMGVFKDAVEREKILSGYEIRLYSGKRHFQHKGKLSIILHPDDLEEIKRLFPE